MAAPPVVDLRRREPVTNSGLSPISVEGLPLGLNKIKATAIQQRRLTNCPLPAVMAAMANACSAKIVRMFQETSGVVKSWFDGEKENARFMTNRIIQVQFRTGSIRVSSVLYFDSFGSPRFARSTDTGAGWVSYLEKAYVVHRAQHRYENLDMDSSNALSVHQVMIDLLGRYDKIELETVVVTKKGKQVVTAQGDVWKNLNENLETTEVYDDLSGDKLESSLEKRLRKVKIKATVATTPAHEELHTRLGLVGQHTYAVISYNDSRDRITLYDAMRGEIKEVSLDDFKIAFDGLYQATE